MPILARMFKRRMKGYRAMGYNVADAPACDTEQGEDYVVEYDEEALRRLDDTEC